MGSVWVKRGGVSLFTVAAVAGAGWFALPADAATGGTATVLAGNKVQYSAGQAAVNAVVVTSSGRTVTIDDRVAIRAGKGCAAVKGDATRVRCTTPADPWQVLVFTHDRNDSIVNKSTIRMTANGGAGSDKIYGGPNQDTLYGDTLEGAGWGDDAIWGMGSNDILVGARGDDGLSGGDGNDRIDFVLLEKNHPNTTAGNDRLYGGTGGDMMIGGLGDDSLYGGAGNDGIEAGAGRDLLDGGDGNDDLLGGNGVGTDSDVIRGGAGRDYVRYNFHTQGVTVDLDGQSGDDGRPGEGDSVAADIEFLYGSRFDDVLTGNAAANGIEALAGDDVIRGGAGDDEIGGGPGADEIHGAAGDDVLGGGDDDGTVNFRKFADLVDGGPNTSVGDDCRLDELDEAVDCETP